jgi:hypothetical protein
MPTFSELVAVSSAGNVQARFEVSFHGTNAKGLMFKDIFTYQDEF